MFISQAFAQAAPAKRSVHWVPSVASLYTQVPLRQENAFLSIGERCNANGSKKFRDLQDAEDWDGITAIAEIVLSAQSSAVGFYRANGFAPLGEPFEEVGITHQEMRLALN